MGLVSTLMGLKPHLSHLRRFSARLKSCPFARVRQIDGVCQHTHGAEAPPLSFRVVFGTTEVVPFRTFASDSGFVSTLMGLKPHLSHLRWFSALLKSCHFKAERGEDTTRWRNSWDSGGRCGRLGPDAGVWDRLRDGDYGVWSR